MPAPARFAAAPPDARLRGALVAWLTVWFAAVAALLGWSLGGGGVVALGAAAAVGSVVPLALLARLAGFPSAFEVRVGSLVVHRYLRRARTFAIEGPVAAGPPPFEARGAAALLGVGYGCRWTRLPTEAGESERAYRAITDPARTVRIGTPDGTVLVTPADPGALARAARAALRVGGAGPAPEAP